MIYCFKQMRIVLLMNNIEKIKIFLDDKTNSTLIFPKISDEIVVFYQLLIQKITKKNNVLCRKIYDYKNLIEMTSPNLFDEKKVYIIDTSDAKNASEDLSKIQDKSQKFFIFMNYASYKKNLAGSLQINTYEFKKDMNFFLADDTEQPSWDDKNKIEFLNFVHNSPHLFFTELDKLKVKILDISGLDGVKQDTQTIISIRKQIFKYKNEFSIRTLPNIYNLIKNEVKIKKFNF